MFLAISNASEEFGNWLLQDMKKTFKTQVNCKKLESFQHYLQEYLNINISAISVYNNGIDNLILKKNDDVLVIQISDKSYLNNIKILNLCKLINYGNAEITPYPIFTQIFDKYAENISEYKLIFKYLEDKDEH